MNEEYFFEYINENEFKKQERAIKKYNMLAYKKLIFEYYPSLRQGKFQGILVINNENENIRGYDLKLPTDMAFSKVHGDIILHYSVYENQKIIMLEKFSPKDILLEGHQKKLSTYKGVMVSQSHKELDMFKINLLSSMVRDENYGYNIYTGNKSVEVKKATKKIDRGIKNKKKIKVNEINSKIEKLALKEEFTINKFKNDKYKNILNDMDKVLDNSFDNMDYYYDKFNKWIIVYLSDKGDKRFLEIKEDFFKYLLKITKDIGLINSINLLRYNALFDINLLIWLKDLVKKSILNEKKYNQVSEQLIYSLNIDSLGKIQQEILYNNKKFKMPIHVIVLILILIVLIGLMYRSIVIENSTDYKQTLDYYIRYDMIKDYPDVLHSKENVEYLASKLNNNDNFYDVVDYLYVYGETVFNYDNGEAYYIRITDNYYEWLIGQIGVYGDCFNKDIVYEVDNSWCDGKNVTSGILKNGGYSFKYMYEIVNNRYVLNYYIYHYDILIGYGEDDTVNCYSDKAVGDIFKEYFEDNDYYVYLLYQHIIIDRDEKTIIFKDMSENKEFKLQVYDKNYDNNERCVVVGMGEDDE